MVHSASVGYTPGLQSSNLFQREFVLDHPNLGQVPPLGLTHIAEHVVVNPCPILWVPSH